MKPSLLKLGFALCLAVTSRAQDSVSTLAGKPLESGAMDGPSSEARFNDPAALAAAPSGDLFVADSQNHVIRKIAPNGSVSTIAGAPLKFDTPCGLAITPQGDLLIADTGNHIIRRFSNGLITTIAGLAGESGAIDGALSESRFNSPLGLAVAPNGTIYVADSGNHLIRAISPAGTVTTVAGSPGNWGIADGPGEQARFNGPLGLALDAQGNLFVSDSNNQTIRQITPQGIVTLWAGQPLIDGFVDGDRLNARFSKPAELALDPHGDLYIADSFNHAIRKISKAGKVSTVTGFSKGVGATDGINGQARFFNPYGLAFLPDGQLAISDSYNQTIRKAFPPTELNFAPDLTITWKSVTGKNYQVQRALPDLTGWINLSPVFTAHESTTSFVPPFENKSDPAFYRVIVSP